MAEPAVVDASPLVILAKARHLELLKLEGERVLVTATVAREIRDHSADAATRALDEEPWLEETGPGPIDVPGVIAAWDLGAGESSVLAWAHAHPGTVAILDDQAARRCAASLDIPYRGCVGLVLLAKRRGLLRQARPVMEELRDAGLYLSDDVIERALALVDE